MKNESSMDRKIRAVIGVVFLVLGSVVFSGTVSIIAYVLGVVMLITAATGFCALYKVLGINTASEKK